jgi:hypothetical protein
MPSHEVGRGAYYYPDLGFAGSPSLSWANG